MAQTHPHAMKCLHRSGTDRLTLAEILRRQWWAAAICCLLLRGAAIRADSGSSTQDLRNTARQLYQRGDYGNSTNAWMQVAERSAAAGDTAGEADARIGLASAYQMHGDYLLAVRA